MPNNTVNKDRFVASRALVLQAMTLIQTNHQCDDPEKTIALVGSAIQKDSGVAAAFNLLGVCVAAESKTLMYKQPEQWQRSGEAIQAALRNNELAYQFKPTQWSRARLLSLSSGRAGSASRASPVLYSLPPASSRCR